MDYFENLPAKKPTTISRKLVTKSNAAERIVNCSRIITPAAVARAMPLNDLIKSDIVVCEVQAERRSNLRQHFAFLGVNAAVVGHVQRRQ